MTLVQDSLFAVILAGGSGTRFWPASRRALPKQLLRIGPLQQPSLLAETVDRIAPLCDGSRVLVATSGALAEACRRALPGLPERSFLAEPMAKNTAACIGWATAVVARRDPEALLMVLPSDHYIADRPGFLAAARRALESASSGPITTLGISPSRPETGYGYLEAREQVGPGVYRVARFVEKPNQERAEQYLAAGGYYWNSGMFFFRARTMLEAIERHLPALHQGLGRIERAAARGDAAEARETAEVFASLESISIDYGIMERVETLNVVPASFGWNDLGSWQSAWELSPKDEHGNAAPPETVLVDAAGNLVADLRQEGRGKVVALLGVQDLCVVDTDDALLIMPRARSEDVRAIVDRLARRGEEDKL